jgi:RNA polymerase sigma factor (sigma-70 family)
MSAPALWTKHRPLARHIASHYFIPGSEPEDVEQEALIALWEAASTYNPTKGTTFPTWARLIINRHVQQCVNVARTGRAEYLTRAVREAVNEDGKRVPVLENLPHLHQVTDRCEEHEDIRRVLATIANDLTPLERYCVLGIASGLHYSEMHHNPKAVDNAIMRARLKLRAAA